MLFNCYLRCNRLHCTLWDEYDERMQLFIDTHDSGQLVVMILQLCKWKKFLWFLSHSDTIKYLRILSWFIEPNLLPYVCFSGVMFMNCSLAEVDEYKMRSALFLKYVSTILM